MPEVALGGGLGFGIEVRGSVGYLCVVCAYGNVCPFLSRSLIENSFDLTAQPKCFDAYRYIILI